MRSKKLAKPKPGPSTKRYLDILEIRDDVVVMKDGTLRAVALVSSINFALKSTDEQEAIIQAYIAFLNGLNFPIQIVVQSRKMNIDAYLLSLFTQQQKTENDLLRAQIADYRNFIKELVDLGEIMQKSFYVVIPYDPLRDKPKRFWLRLVESVSPASSIKLKEKQFQTRKDEIVKRATHILGQLSSLGVIGAMLDTQSLIELYYSTYNPDLFETEKLVDIDKIKQE